MRLCVYVLPHAATALMRRASSCGGKRTRDVWMRTAGLPTFRKLYAIVEGGLEKGKFDTEVHSNFNVESFGGNKKLIVSTVSWLGGKNYFLGVAYLVVGIISLLLALAFFAKHIKNPRKLGDSEYLVWSDKDKQS